MTIQTRLQLHLSARDLPLRESSFLSLKKSSKVNPFAVVSLCNNNDSNTRKVIGQTSVMFKNQNPSWPSTLIIDNYKPGQAISLVVDIYHFDSRPTGQSEDALAMLDVYAATAILKSTLSQLSSNNNQQKGSLNGLDHNLLDTIVFELDQELNKSSLQQQQQYANTTLSKVLPNGGTIQVHVEQCLIASTNQNNILLLQIQGRLTTQTSQSTSAATTCTALLNSSSSKLFASTTKRNNNYNNNNTTNGPVNNNLNNNCSPYFEIFRKARKPTGDIWLCVYRSNILLNTVEPLWTVASHDIKSWFISNDETLKVIVFDHKQKDLMRTVVGEVETTLEGILNAQESFIPLQLSKFDQVVGSLHIIQAQLLGESRNLNHNVIVDDNDESDVPETELFDATDLTSMSATAITQQQHRPDFVDYLSSGTQINVAVAIDFTASNGDPREAGTPHFFYSASSSQWNDYEKALFAVGSILAKYDSDQKFPVWGFGAKYQNVVRHCFQCGSEMEVEGVQGIMDAYRGVFRTPLTMSYPVCYKEVIQTAASYARYKEEVAEEDSQLSYTILLILTAGDIQNIDETKQALIDSSDDPLSIVVVGVGASKFQTLSFLDEQTTKERSISKFVRFSDYKSFSALSEAVLEEIPNQLVSYYYGHGILPRQYNINSGRFNYYQSDVRNLFTEEDGRIFTNPQD